MAKISKVTGGKTGFGSSFYKDLSRVEKRTRVMGREIEKVNGTLKLWFSRQGGWLFNKVAAVELAGYIRRELSSGSAFGRGGYYFDPLSDFWSNEKKRKGFIADMGRANDFLLNNITHYKTGNDYAAGIKPSAKAPLIVSTSKGDHTTGKIRNIARYGTYLERGRPAAVGARGATGKQEPRPWFYSSFSAWLLREFPDLARRTFAKKLAAHVNRLIKEGATGGYSDPENIISDFTKAVSTHADSPADAVTEQRKTTKLEGRRSHSEEVPTKPRQFESSTKKRKISSKKPYGKEQADEFGNRIVKVLDEGSNMMEETWFYNTDDDKWYEIEEYYKSLGIDFSSD